MNEDPPVALSIAGSDSGGGAGIQADLKTFASLGVFGTSAITALTAQNTSGVSGVHVTPAEFVDAQVTAVVSDLRVVAVKTGMLAAAATVEAVTGRAAAGDLPNLVVDPVMVSSSGDRLLEPDAESYYRDLLIPQALVVTPNLREAGILVGRRLSSLPEMHEAAERIHAMGSAIVVVKGGHLSGPESPDVVFDGKVHEVLASPRVPTRNVHGTGCTLSAAIAAHLALGREPLTAIHEAKSYVGRAIAGGAGWALGAGHGPLDQLGWSAQRTGSMSRQAERAPEMRYAQMQEPLGEKLP